MIISIIVAIVGVRSACMVFFSVKEILKPLSQNWIWFFFAACDCVIVAACAKYLFNGGL